MLGTTPAAVAGGVAAFSPRVQLAAIEVELVLGICLLVGRPERLLWLVTLGFFSVMTGISLHLGMGGWSSCGCGGAIEINPWAVFIFDLLCVAALVWLQPRPNRTQPQPANLAYPLAALFAAFVIAGAVTVSAQSAKVHDFVLRHIYGQEVVVEPALSDLGTLAPGEAKRFELLLTNVSTKPICLIGGTKHCAARATGDLPLTLNPGEAKRLAVTCRCPPTVGRFLIHYELFTDGDATSTIPLRVGGLVQE